MTKYELLREIKSFVNACYMFMKNGAAEFASENFTKLVNEKWDDSKSDDENVLEVKKTFDTNITLNKALGNTEAVKVIETFLEYSEFDKIV